MRQIAPLYKPIPTDWKCLVGQNGCAPPTLSSKDDKSSIAMSDTAAFKDDGVAVASIMSVP